jgi:hypothetical protein
MPCCWLLDSVLHFEWSRFAGPGNLGHAPKVPPRLGGTCGRSVRQTGVGPLDMQGQIVASRKAGDVERTVPGDGCVAAG